MAVGRRNGWYPGYHRQPFHQRQFPCWRGAYPGPDVATTLCADAPHWGLICLLMSEGGRETGMACLWSVLTELTDGKCVLIRNANTACHLRHHNIGRRANGSDQSKKLNSICELSRNRLQKNPRIFSRKSWGGKNCHDNLKQRLLQYWLRLISTEDA